MILCTDLRLSIDNKCSSHDWAIDIRKVVAPELAEAPAPFQAQALEKCLKFTGKTLAGSFPSISIARHFIENHDIQTVQGKATWTYLLSGLYSLEVTVHHKWYVESGHTRVLLTAIWREKRTDMVG